MADNNLQHDGGNPVENLWDSVILQAWEDKRLWFFTSSKSNFEWICRMRGYDAESIRKIAKLKFGGKKCQVK